VVTATGQRIGWDDVPADVRAGIEGVLGAPVVSATSQPGGFSPGTADRVLTARGRRAFVKAVCPALNERSVEMHRREATVSAALPSSVPAPRLIGSYDDGTWVAVVLEDVDGVHPRTPWAADEVTAVLDALRRVAAHDAGRLPVDLPSAAQDLAADLTGWDAAAADPERLDAVLSPFADHGLAAWARTHLDDLVALSARARGDLAGDALLHLDVRADNLLVRPDGEVVLVDWPWACRGPGWVDALALLVNVRLHDPDHDVGRHLAHPALASLDAETAVAFLAGLAGFFLHVSTEPPVPNLPTLRSFQRAQGESTLAWARELATGC
jgi:hypothetical protein